MATLDDYRRYVTEINEYAAANGISTAETNEIFEQCFYTLDVKFSKKVSLFRKIFRLCRNLLTVIFILIFCVVLLYNHQSTHKIVLRNIQNFIYPGLKLLRTIAVPIIKRFPSLTEFYDEWCLVENPYFRVSDMDCWPCSSVRSIPDLTGRNISSEFNIGIPYTRQDNQIPVKTGDLLEMYEQNMHIFDNDANRVFSNNASYRTIKDVFEKRLDKYPTVQLETHILWRILRMEPGRLIRKLFPRPMSVPKIWSQSTEKFVFIDEPLSQIYPLPNPECSNVVLKCSSGSRLINMVPSSECSHSCKSFTILLSAGQTLWYNWWYWRPLSIPTVNSTDISINYLISFC
ncbi:uncharacterized protein [Venturia canescens]|uniref:uncharacterized protein isoform X2 n=1 Tax=Venturia canescens TaxID=32260 RepID=UPI001C9C19B0|nr:uncharacterized protein LOC122406661 isoform X2 [Venturia canescens]